MASTTNSLPTWFSSRYHRGARRLHVLNAYTFFRLNPIHTGRSHTWFMARLGIE